LDTSTFLLYLNIYIIPMFSRITE